MLERGVLQDQLRDSTRLVLARMCSLIPSAGDGLSEEQRRKLACVRVQFSGTLRGSLVMAAEDDAAQMFAPAFLGLRAEELAPDAVPAVLAEMANMICGATISRMEPDGEFRLSTPAPFAPLPATEACTAEIGLDCGCGGLIVQMWLVQMQIE